MHTALEAIVNRFAQGFGASNTGLLRRAFTYSVLMPEYTLIDYLPCRWNR
jgi:hypothetical protein